MKLVQSKKQSKLKALEKAMDSATSYEKWKEAATEHDKVSGKTLWKRQDHSDLFDYLEIRSRLDNLRNIRRHGDDHELIFTLNEGIHGNMGGMGNGALFEETLIGTKNLIRDYVDELVDSIRYLADPENDQVDFDTKLDFFNRASHCYGRSALMLSGGGSFGYFHVGVVKALLEQNLLPTVISGASIGAFMAGMVGTRTDDELKQDLDKGNIRFSYKSSQPDIKKTVAGEISSPMEFLDIAEERLACLIPDLTFQEAYELTGRAINISVSPTEPHQQSRLLNAITSPNVYVRSAVLASCAVPGLLPPVTLKAKNVRGESQYYLPSRQWLDGSFSEDLPIKRLARLYGVNHNIVSLVNPAAVQFAPDTQKQSYWGPLKKFMIDATRAYSHSMQLLSQKHLPESKLSFAINQMNSIITQDYTGDINMILPGSSVFKVGRFFPPIPQKDMDMLIREGEKAAWRKMEQIRLATKISSTMDEILYEMEGIHQSQIKAVYKRSRKSAA